MDKFHDDEYLRLMGDVIANGVSSPDRTGTGTISIFGADMSFDLSNYSIPMLTTKLIHTKSIIHELLWYLKGDSNIKYLNDNGVRIWNEWADENGDLGPVYPTQWRKLPQEVGATIKYETDPPTAEIQYEYIDQIATVITQLKEDPNSRRIIIDSWNVGLLDKMKLPPCHAFVQFYSRELYLQERNQIGGLSGENCVWNHEELSQHNIPARALSCKLYQRSADVFLGVPFNIVQYSILTHMIAQVTDHVAEKFIWTGGDVHIYNNHFDQCYLQMTREAYPSPTLKLNPTVRDIDDFEFRDFVIDDYKHHDAIKATVSV
mgnify:CR=1 FL=1